METASQAYPLTKFEFEGNVLTVKYRETTKFDDYPGVECDVYDFVGDNSMDLGIIRIDPGCKTPRQKVLKGDRTVEGFVGGNGMLIIENENGHCRACPVYSQMELPFSTEVEIGDVMQWRADIDSALTVYEICKPKYKDGRYTNLPEEVEASKHVLPKP